MRNERVAFALKSLCLNYYSFMAGLVLGLFGGVMIEVAAMYAMLHGAPALYRLIGGA